MLSALMRRMPARARYVLFVVMALQAVLGIHGASAQSMGCVRLQQFNLTTSTNYTTVINPSEFVPGDTLILRFMDNGLDAGNNPTQSDIVQISPAYNINNWLYRHASGPGTGGSYAPVTPPGYLAQNGLYLRIRSGPYLSKPNVICRATVVADPVAVTQPPTHDAVVEVPYLHTFAAAGGTGSYTFAITSGIVPPGLRLETDGRLMGEPTAQGSYSFTVTATDSNNAIGSANYDLNVRTGNPGQPTNVSAVAGDGEALVYFDAPARTGGQPIVQYEAYASTGQSASGPTSPLRVAGLANGTPVHFMVWASNGNSVGPESDSTNSVTPVGAQVIDFPQPAEQTLGALLTLPASTDRGLAIDYSTSTPQVCGISPPNQVQMLTIGTCTLTASQSGNTEYSAAQSITHTFNVQAALPGAPRIFGASAIGPTEVMVDFGAPQDDGGSPVLDYEVVASPGGITASGPSAPIRVTGLEQDTLYTFVARARTAVGSGPGSAPSSPLVTPAIARVDRVSIAPGRYFLGEAIMVEVVFDRTVEVHGPPTIVLDIGGTQRHAYYHSGHGGRALSFWYFPQMGDQDDDGVAVERLEMGGGRIYAIGTTITADVTLRNIDAAGVLVGPTVPDAPTITNVAAGDAEATIAFDAPFITGGAAIQGYTITASPGGRTLDVSGSPATMTGLVNGTHYTFTVAAKNMAGMGAPSVPSATVLPAAAQVAQVIDFPQPDAQDYGTQLHLQASSSSALPVSFTTDTPLVCALTGATLSFQSVGACTITASQPGNAGYSPAQPVTHTFDVRAALPGAPRMFGASAIGPTEVVVNFGAPLDDGGSPVLDYEVVASPGGITASGTSAPIRVTGLEQDTLYTFVARARTAVGSGPGSDASSPVVTPAIARVDRVSIAPGRYFLGEAIMVEVVFDRTVVVNGLPAIVLDIGGTPRYAGYHSGHGGRVLSFWYFPQMGDQDDDGVAVERLEMGGGSIHAVGTTIDADLTLRNIDAAGVLVGPTVPDAPTITNVTAGDAEATIAFDAPFITGGAAIQGYTITASPGGRTLDVTGSPATMTGLVNGTHYTFTVAAKNMAGMGAPSVPSATVLPVAAQVAQVIDFPQPDAQDYGTQLHLQASSSSALPVNFTTATPLVCALTGTTLSFQRVGTCVIHADQAGDAATLAASQVTRSFDVRSVTPGMPAIVSVRRVGPKAVDVEFTPPADDGGSPITGYDVVVAPGGRVVSGSTSPIHVDGLSRGSEYRFTVSARNAAGAGVSSASSDPVSTLAEQWVQFTQPHAQDIGTSLQLDATSSAGLPITYASSTPQVCSVDGEGRVTSHSIGICTIAASQPGDASHEAAQSVVRSFLILAVAPGRPSIESVVMVTGDTAEAIILAPAANGGSPITEYEMTAQPSGLQVRGSGSPLRLSGLPADEPQVLTVVAINAEGKRSVASMPSLAVTAASLATIREVIGPRAQRYLPGDALVIGVRFDQPLQVNGTPRVSIRIGAQLRDVPLDAALQTDGMTTLQFRYVVQPQDSDEDGIELTHLAVAPGMLVDLLQREAIARLDGEQRFVSVLVGGHAATAPSEVRLVPGDSLVEVHFTVPGDAGTSPITGYTVVAQPGNITVTAPASPITVPGLVNGTSYSFTVTATTAFGQGQTSSAVAATPVPALHAAPVTLSLPYGAGPTPVPLDVTGQPISVQIVSEPLMGTVKVEGAAVTYAPSAGFAGDDSFSYTVHDGFSTSEPATVSITVGSTTLQLDGPAPVQATAGSAYSAQMSTRGGHAPYTYELVSGNLPGGITLSRAGRLDGELTSTGVYEVEIEVSDSSNGIGPFRARRTVSITVTAPQIDLPAGDLPQVIQSDDVNQRLQVTGGAAPYAFRLMSGALPHGVTLGEDGALTGTASEAGTFDFEVEVTDANGFTAIARYRMQVAQSVQVISGFVADPGAPTYSEGGTFALTAVGGASGQPVVFASTTPAVCTVSGSTVTMLAAGRCSLTADQAGDGNHQAAAQQRLDVDIAVAVPVLVWETELTHMVGEGSFELPLPASPSPGAFTFESSDTAVASVDGRTVTIHGEGTAVITARQAASGSYAAASMELRLVIKQRPDPTRDADVTGLLQAQVDASVRFATAQQANIRDRLRQVRAGGNAGSNTVNLSNGSAGRNAASLPVGQLAGDGADLLPKGWGSWAAGTATYGRGGAQRDGRYDLRTDGLTVGVDRALGEHGLFGVAGSIGRNDSGLQDSDSEMRADQRSLALYGLWRAGAHVFVDGMLATGNLEFDLRRWSRDAGAMGLASRDGSQWFGSLGIGYEQDVGAMRMTGYGRYDASRSTLDAYREKGLGAYDLAYGRHVVENRALAVGLEGSLQPAGDARLRPFWSMEYRHALQDRGTATLNYAQWAHAQDYAVGMRSYNDNALSLSAGMDIRLQRGWMLSLLLGHEQTRASSESSSIGLRLSSGGQAGVVRQPMEQQAVQPAVE